MRTTLRTTETGFTLIEVLVVCVLLSALLAISAPAYISWGAARAQQDTARDVVSQLRAAQVRAQAEVTPYRVDIDADSVDTYRVPASGTPTLIRSYELSSTRVALSGGTFVDSKGAGSRVWFFPRGNSSDGQVTVARDGSATTYTIEVEGLTSRVSFDD